MRNILTLGGFAGVTLLCIGLQAKPVYLVDMVKLYQGSKLATGCSLCHDGRHAYTSYGADFLRLREFHGIENMDRVWDELGQLDSNRDGVPNDVWLVRKPAAPVPARDCAQDLRTPR